MLICENFTAKNKTLILFSLHLFTWLYSMFNALLCYTYHNYLFYNSVSFFTSLDFVV